MRHRRSASSRSTSSLRPNFEQRNKMMHEYAGHLAKLVNLGLSCRSQPMINREFLDRETSAMHSCNELPPEPLLHLTQFVNQPMYYVLLCQNEGTTRVMHRHSE